MTPYLTSAQARRMMTVYPGHMIQQALASGRIKPPLLSGLDAARKTAPQAEVIRLYPVYYLDALEQVRKAVVAKAAHVGRE
ncbi:hypothetical protein [Paradevosia shaoguanensis]|uniref:hypothetical protein n=1 Tax=Paradevosia shaoguanensis TaxID=1335043 RepID=UPI003C794836